MALAKVSIDTFTEEDLNDFVELSLTEYDSLVTTDIDHTRWKHIDSPFGASSYIRLVVDDKTVGRSLLQPRTIDTISGRFTTACVADVIIDPEHRSPTTNFFNLTNASTDTTKYSSVFHTANERTEPFYRKLFKLPNPFSLCGYGFPTRLSGVVSKVTGYQIKALDWLYFPVRIVLNVAGISLMWLAKINVSEQLPSDEDLSALSSKLLHDSGPILTRSSAFLKWRLLDAPLWAADIYCIDRNGKHLGYVATRKLELNGLYHLVLIDFLLDTDMSLLERMALRLWLIRRAIKLDVDALFTMINPDSRVAGTCVGFPMIRISDKFLPHGTPIFFRAISDESMCLESARMTHMTLADIDYF